jgi:hypothetical protein
MFVIKAEDIATAHQTLKESVDLVILGKQYATLATEFNSTKCIVLCSSIQCKKLDGVYYLPLPLRLTKLYLLYIMELVYTDLDMSV